MQVRWTPDAADDLEAIVDYIQRNNPSAAQEIATIIYDGAASLAQFSSLGRPGTKSGTRELTFGGLPYVLVYKLEKDAVWLLHIFHGAQDWQ